MFSLGRAIVLRGYETVKESERANRIDYIFATPDLELSEVGFPKSTASDHLAVAATVTFAEGF